ncbi:MAG: ABC transporter substrate-binding protein [Rubrivivax sp.]
MMNIHKRLLIGMLAGFSAAAFAQPQPELRIGFIGMLSGAGAAWGTSVGNSVQMVVDDVNAKGGLEVAGRKYKVTVIPYDDKYKPNEAVTALNRLIFDDKVKFVVGPMGGAPGLAALPLATENKVITISFGWADKILTPEYKYNFRATVPSQVFANAQLKWVVGKLGVRRVGALFASDASGQDAAKVFETAYEQAGAKLVAKESFERERVDFVPLLTRVLAQNIDAFELNSNAPASAGLMVKQLRELGFKGAIVSTNADTVAEMLRIAGPAATNDMYVHQGLDAGTPAMKEHARRYLDRFKVPMVTNGPPAAVAVQRMLTAMQKAGTVTDTDKVLAAMDALPPEETMLGRTEWYGQARWGINHQLFSPFYIGQLKNGQVSIVAKCTPEKCE